MQALYVGNITVMMFVHVIRLLLPMLPSPRVIVVLMINRYPMPSNTLSSFPESIVRDHHYNQIQRPGGITSVVIGGSYTCQLCVLLLQVLTNGS